LCLELDFEVVLFSLKRLTWRIAAIVAFVAVVAAADGGGRAVLGPLNAAGVSVPALMIPS
jgi:hypothetical protein